MDERIEEEISHDDSTPTLVQQAEKEGWKFGFYDFGKADDGLRAWFNPAIIQRGEEIWLLVRGSEPHPQGFPYGQNSIWAFELDQAGKTPKRGIRLRWDANGNVDPDQHFEDPRGFWNENIHQTIISACTFIWYPEGRWTGAHQCIGSFDTNWQSTKFDYPKLGGGSGQLEILTDKTKYEKNWLPFLHDNRLHILYKADPWMVIGFGATWSDMKEYRSQGVKWAYGDVRGGSSPVLVGDTYFTFPHSSLPWRGRYRRYYAGCMSFEAKPPFRPLAITPEPILRGSQNDPWAQRKPLVAFPCGAMFRDGKWLVTLGVNDLKAAWVEIPHEDLLKRMVPIVKSGSPVFPANGLTPSEIEARQKLLNPVPVLAETESKGQNPDSGEARDSTTHYRDGTKEPHESCGGIQKLSEERLAKLRENAAKARAAKAAKRLAVNGETGEPSTGVMGVSPSSTRSHPLHRKRRKRMRRKRTAEEKLKAASEFSCSKENG